MLSSISATRPSADWEPSQIVNTIFKKIDTNRDDKITVTELSRALDSTSQSDQKLSAETVFQLLDTGNKGYLTKQDLAAAAQPAAAAAQTSTTEASPPRAGHGGGPPPPPSDTSTTEIDPADTNQDGQVSQTEQLAYSLKQYAAAQVPATIEPQSVIYG